MSDTTYKVKRCFWYQRPHEHVESDWTFLGARFVTCEYSLRNHVLDIDSFKRAGLEIEEREEGAKSDE